MMLCHKCLRQKCRNTDVKYRINPLKCMICVFVLFFKFLKNEINHLKQSSVVILYLYFPVVIYSMLSVFAAVGRLPQINGWLLCLPTDWLTGCAVKLSQGFSHCQTIPAWLCANCLFQVLNNASPPPLHPPSPWDQPDLRWPDIRVQTAQTWSRVSSDEAEERCIIMINKCIILLYFLSWIMRFLSESWWQDEIHLILLFKE